MSFINRVGSFLDYRRLKFQPSDTSTAKFVKVASGVGVVGVALVSWKVIVASGLAYSTYRGGKYLYGRCTRKRSGENLENVEIDDVDITEPQAIAPVQAADETDEEDHKEDPSLHAVDRAVEEEVHPQENSGMQRLLNSSVERDELHVLKNLREKAQNKKTVLVLDAMLSHPKVRERITDLQWLRNTPARYAKMSTLRLHAKILKNKVKTIF